MKKKTISFNLQGWRWFIKIILATAFFIIPWIKLSGESILRFDVPTLRLYFFGTILYLEDFFLVLLVTLAFTFFFLLVTITLGRIWCGWCCPQTVLCDLTDFLQRRKYLFYPVVFFMSIIISLTIIWYFISPYDFWSNIFQGKLPGKLTTAFFIGILIPTFLNFAFWRRSFCAKVCPYARAQTMLFDSKTLVIAFDAERKEECINCRACVRKCPINIDIRQGLNIACIACAECLSVCDKIFAKKKKSGLIRYFWGDKKTISLKELLRPPVTISAVLFFSTLSGALVYSTKMAPVEAHLIKDPYFKISTKDTFSIHSYILSLENKKKAFYTLKFSTSPSIKIEPKEITLTPEEKIKTRIFLFVPQGTKNIELNISINERILKKETLRL
ncbi:MAG: 4Fe-4S binding protein [Caldimicrobium sp.]|nr:4Fe-4S binding protein [Caldimicrobium sp.]MCX7873963.1 4Fe-4S binding protein [Caldimicrobium sp.]MDW8094198.1 4Fe-4S dicluster domain-containing protein [Caldimicrobium sp.]